MGTKRENTPERELQGTVVKNRMDKTVVVEVVRHMRHPKYMKYIRRPIRYKAHDPNNECNVGDRVLLSETRPLSKDKRWRVKEIMERAALLQ